MIRKLHINKFFDYLLIFSLCCFIFLWPVNIFTINAKYFILFSILPIFYFSIFEFYTSLKKYLIAFCVTSLFLIHFFFVNNLSLNDIPIQTIKELFYIFFLVLFGIFFYKNFISYKEKIILLFIYIFLCSCILSFLNFKFDDPYFCGGVKDYFFIFRDHVIQTHVEAKAADSFLWLKADYLAKNDLKFINFKISFKEFLFKENSHLAISGVPIICYFLFNNNKFNFFSKFCISLFTFICIIKSSTTFIIGLTLALLFLLVIGYKKVSFKRKFLILIFPILLIYLFVNDDLCRNKLSPSYGGENIVSDQKSEKINNFLGAKKGSLSSALAYKYLIFAIENFQKNFFGTGIGTFYKQSVTYTKLNENKLPNFDTYNLKDGTNNFNKILVEFGIFAILFYMIIFHYSIKSNIPFSEKTLLLPFLIVQSLRGAGYYNGGFALISIILLISYISSFNNSK